MLLTNAGRNFTEQPDLLCPESGEKISAKGQGGAVRSQTLSEALSQAQGKDHMEEFGVTLPPARSCVWSFDLMSMHIYQIWDPLLGGKCAS